MERRKITFKLYPTGRQEKALHEFRALHCELYDAALEERRSAWEKEGRSVSYLEQQNALPLLKQDRPDLIPLGSHALQETLRRVDRAYQAFFRRVKNGEEPGFPRFKPLSRFHSFTYPDPAGWNLKLGSRRTAWIRVGKVGWIRARGKHRFGAIQPNDLTVIYRHGCWYASVTVRVEMADCVRPRAGEDYRGFDLGLSSLLTFDNGESIDNPRWLKSALDTLKHLQRERARKQRGSRRYRQLSRRIAGLHRTIENRRRDFLHKLSAGLVKDCAVLASEALKLKNMSAKGGSRKKGLNRELRSSGFGMLLQMLKYKAEEAGTRLHLANTRQLKPTQRCACCGHVVKKTLATRVHRCERCGFETDRDRNSALVCLLDAFGCAPGTGASARELPLALASVMAKAFSMTRETATTTRSV